MDVLMDEILTRLPAKSLMRFKCVSKLWSSFITSKYFTNRFLSFPSPRLYLSFEDYSDHTKSVTLSFAPSSSSSSKRSSSSFEFEYDLTITDMEGCILQNPRGVMYCYTGMFNHTFRQHITLPVVKPSDIAPLGHGTTFKILPYSIGHDPFRNHYKVVCTIGMCSQSWQHIKSERWVFVLGGGGGVWRIATPRST